MIFHYSKSCQCTVTYHHCFQYSLYTIAITKRLMYNHWSGSHTVTNTYESIYCLDRREGQHNVTMKERKVNVLSQGQIERSLDVTVKKGSICIHCPFDRRKGQCMLP